MSYSAYIAILGSLGAIVAAGMVAAWLAKL
jgi:hypothetical protein